MKDIDQLQTDLIRCPNCGQTLEAQHCRGCGTYFPERMGILDMRWPRPTAPDPAEEALIEQLIAAFPTSSFEELVEMRFRQTGTSAEFMAVYNNYYHTLEARGQQMMEMFQERLSDYFKPPAQGVALDVGCGIGASSAVLVHHFEQVVGIEPSLITLILARKFFAERGLEGILLVQAYGQHLPLAADCIDYAVAQNVIEHLLDIEPAFRELNRVLKSGGCFCGDSRNRFDILFPEPHTNLHWVGFWPYKLQPWYVQRFKKMPYLGTRLLSLRELSQTARRIFGRSTRVVFPLASAYGQSAKWDRYLQRLEKIPLLRQLLLMFFPSHLLLVQAE